MKRMGITCSKKSLTVRHGEVEKEKIEEEISEGWMTSFTPEVEEAFWTFRGWVASLTPGVEVSF